MTVPDKMGAESADAAQGGGLFRPQVLAQRNERLVGELILSQPLSARVLVQGLTFVVVLTLVLLASNSYTRKVSVQGRLVPDQGLIEVTAPARGRIVELLVAAGERVEAGQPLFRLRLDHTLDGAQPLSSALTASLRQQHARVQEQVRLQEAALQRAADDTAAQLLLVDASIQRLQDMQQREGQLAALQQQALQRSALLMQQGHLARAEYEALQVQALQQEQAVQQLALQLLQERTQRRDLLARQSAAHSQGQQQMERLQGELAELDQRLLRVAAEQDTVQTAPLAARIGTLHLQAGMPAAVDQPVLALLPDGAALQAELLVPSAAIGFVAPGQQVKLRYDAFPYQKFGLQQARLAAVMQSPEPVRQGETTAPYYRVLAELERQSVQAYGTAQPLLAGMQFTADVLVDRRSLLEWLLEPLFSIRGRA